MQHTNLHFGCVCQYLLTEPLHIFSIDSGIKILANSHTNEQQLLLLWQDTSFVFLKNILFLGKETCLHHLIWGCEIIETLT